MTRLTTVGLWGLVDPHPGPATLLLPCRFGAGLSRASMASHQVKAAMVRADIPEASAHSLRHTFISRLTVRGVPMKAIADLVGQSTPTITARYMHLQPEHLRAAMEALERPAPNLHGSNASVKPDEIS